MDRQDITHAEVWDDSYLQDSWNEAVKEYEKYHSLAAKKLDGPALIRELQQSGEIPTEDEIANHINGRFDEVVADEDYEPGELLEANADLSVPVDTEHRMAEQDATIASAKATHNATCTPKQTISNTTQSQPPQLSIPVQDDNLRNLMMSWYYAGYYTGFHEGQQNGNGSNTNAAQGG